ncbi:amino acid permease [uncultured Clostridium sp.]|uniref:APC family permease n=1 Tax=uncultured Clostridium sp. TaxID=59620 RepID=UPI00261C78E3|nr:amino acid permease [uncultured Clostridium sp.]
MKLFQRKNVYDVIEGTKNEHKVRSLKTFDLVLLTIGTVIGTGVLVLPGVVAATTAGPSEILSYIIAGIASIFVVFCYSEFASSIPTAGGSYSYIYVSMGKFFALIAGASVLLGYILILGFVSNGWAAYFDSFLEMFGVKLPFALTHIPTEGGIVNLPAIIVVLLMTLLLSKGTKDSKKINNLMVLIKVLVILIFIIVGVFYFDASNLSDFFPMGVGGTLHGAAILFLAYSGFDVTASAAEETIDPQKTIPKALILSIFACITIYSLVSLILTAMVPYNLLNQPDALSYALLKVGQTIPASLLSLGAIIGILAIIFAVCFGCSRILANASKDDFIPKAFAKENKNGVPIVSLWFLGIVGSILGGFININVLSNTATLALLFVYLMVCIALIVFRKTDPDFKRSFKTPLVPLIPILGVLCCGYLMIQIPYENWIYFVIFVIVALLLQLIYLKFKEKRKHSEKLHNEN